MKSLISIGCPFSASRFSFVCLIHLLLKCLATLNVISAMIICIFLSSYLSTRIIFFCFFIKLKAVFCISTSICAETFFSQSILLHRKDVLEFLYLTHKIYMTCSPQSEICIRTSLTRVFANSQTPTDLL